MRRWRENCIKQSVIVELYAQGYTKRQGELGKGEWNGRAKRHGKRNIEGEDEEKTINPER